MRVKVINPFNKPVIDKLFPLGNEFDIELILTTKDEVIHNGLNESGSSKHLPIFPRHIRPKGSYKGFKIKAIDGNYYDSNYLIHWYMMEVTKRFWMLLVLYVTTRIKMK